MKLVFGKWAPKGRFTSYSLTGYASVRVMNRPNGSKSQGRGMAFFFMALCLGFVLTAQAQLATTVVFVGNQGNFSDANGSVSIYTPSTGMVIEDGIPDLNTLVQNIAVHAGQGYILANTSDRIDVFDVSTNVRTGQITDVPSPRYFAGAGVNKAYVSNLFSNSVSIIDLAGNIVTGSISVGNNPEDIAVAGNFAYVANNGFGFDSTLTRIDITTDTIIDTINLACDGPRSLEVDGQDELWVFCNGKTVYNSDFSEIIEQTNGQVLVLDGASGALLNRFELDAQMGASSAGQDTYYDPVTDQIFAVQGSQLLTFDTSANSQVGTINISGDEPIGSVAFDASSNQFYVARIPGFTIVGYVSVHGLDGVEINRFNAGIAPTTITLLQTGTSVAAEAFETEVPQSFQVYQNYPNPFNPTTTISFDMLGTAVVTIKIYNILGIEVATLTNSKISAGSHNIVWDAAGLPSGSYFYRVSSGDFISTKKMTLIK